MSIQAMNYVWEHSPYTGTKRLIHIAIADVVNDMHGNEFFMKNEGLAEKAACTRSYANQVLKEMVDDGALEVVGMKGPIVNYRFIFKGVQNSNTECLESEQGGVNSVNTSVNSVNTEPNTKTRDNPKLELKISETSVSDDYKTVWDAWVKSRLDFTKGSRTPKETPKRKKLINNALKEFSVEDLVLAVTGWTKNSFHRGENSDGKVYNSLELLLRDTEKIEQFIGYHDKAPSKQTISEKWERNGKTPSGTIILDNTEVN